MTCHVTLRRQEKRGPGFSFRVTCFRYFFFPYLLACSCLFVYLFRKLSFEMNRNFGKPKIILRIFPQKKSRCWSILWQKNTRRQSHFFLPEINFFGCWWPWWKWIPTYKTSHGFNFFFLCIGRITESWLWFVPPSRYFLLDVQRGISSLSDDSLAHNLQFYRFHQRITKFRWQYSVSKNYKTNMPPPPRNLTRYLAETLNCWTTET